MVDGGRASAGPPIGPALGPTGVNIGQVISEINDKTRAFEGMKVPVKIIIDPIKKSFQIEVGTPPASALILKQLKLEKGSGSALDTKVGDISIDQLVKVAAQKESNLLGATLKARVKEVLGTCVSMGVTADGGKDPRDVQKAITAGAYDGQLKG
jgi:large subunit ribosomal protein L11